NCVGARIASISDHDDLNRTKPSNIRREIEVLEHSQDFALEVLFEISVVNPGNRDLSDLRNVNLPGTVYNHAQIRRNLPTNIDLQFVTRADDVVAGNLHPVDWRKRARRLQK